MSGRPPTPPSWLSTQAKAQWKRLGGKLHRLGLLDALSKAGFAIYCESWGTYERLTREIAEHGETYETKTGYIRPHPRVAMRDEALKQARIMGGEFFLTPNSRGELDLQPSPAQDDFDAFVNRKSGKERFFARPRNRA